MKMPAHLEKAAQPGTGFVVVGSASQLAPVCCGVSVPVAVRGSKREQGAGHGRVLGVHGRHRKQVAFPQAERQVAQQQQQPAGGDPHVTRIGLASLIGPASLHPDTTMQLLVKYLAKQLAPALLPSHGPGGSPCGRA